MKIFYWKIIPQARRAPLRKLKVKRKDLLKRSEAKGEHFTIQIDSFWSNFSWLEKRLNQDNEVVVADAWICRSCLETLQVLTFLLRLADNHYRLKCWKITKLFSPKKKKTLLFFFRAQNSQFYSTLKHVIFLVSAFNARVLRRLFFYYRIINQMKMCGSYTILLTAASNSELRTSQLDAVTKFKDHLNAAFSVIMFMYRRLLSWWFQQKH